MFLAITSYAISSTSHLPRISPHLSFLTSPLTSATGVGGSNRSGSVAVFMANIFTRNAIPWQVVEVSPLLLSKTNPHLILPWPLITCHSSHDSPPPHHAILPTWQGEPSLRRVLPRLLLDRVRT